MSKKEETNPFALIGFTIILAFVIMLIGIW